VLFIDKKALAKKSLLGKDGRGKGAPTAQVRIADADSEDEGMRLFIARALLE